MDLNKKLEELKPYQLNCNVFDVYSYNGLTMQDLLCQFFTKINECIHTSNETIDLAKWLVNEGLEIEVVKKLMMWLEDGTLENIINVNLFNSLNEKINRLRSQFENKTNGFEYNKPIFVFIDDDGAKDFYTKGLKQTFDNNNIKTTLAINTGKVGLVEDLTYMSWEELKQLEAEGFEIVSHSHTHNINFRHDNITNMSVSAIEYELYESYRLLKENGFSNYNLLVYPYGYWDNLTDRNKVINIAKKYYICGVNAGGEINYSPINNMYMDRVFYDGMTYEDMKIKVDKCLNTNGLLLIGTHSWSGITTDKIDRLIKYIKSNNGEIKTLSQALKLKGNSISNGTFEDGFYIGLDGSTNKLKFSDGSKLGFDFVPSTNNLIELVSIPNTQDTITQKGGICTYFKGKDNNYIYRTFINIDNEYFISYFNVETHSWKEFIKINNNSIITNTFTESLKTQLANYPQNNFVIEHLQNIKDNLTGKGGVVITYKGIDNNYAFKLFINTENRTFISYYDVITNNWSDFSELYSYVTTIRDYTNTLNKGINEYVRFNETIEHIPQAYDTITNSGGVLRTYRGIEDIYSYRTFVNIHGRFFISNWNNSSWTEFVEK